MDPSLAGYPKALEQQAPRLQRALLRRLIPPHGPFTFLLIDRIHCDDNSRLVEWFRQEIGGLMAGKDTSIIVDKQALTEALWVLLRRGLVVVFPEDGSPIHTAVQITAAGRHALSDDVSSPHDPSGFLERLKRKAPDISDVTLRYVQEALGAFENDLWFGSMILIGVAAEAAFLDMAQAFVPLLNTTEQANLTTCFSGTAMFSKKFDETRRKMQANTRFLPKDFADNLDLHLNAMGTLLRNHRNSVGHPTGANVDKDDCRVALELAHTYLVRLYNLKAHFESQAAAGSSPTTP